MYINKLDDTVNKYNNTYHSTTKMMPVDVKSRTYMDFDKKVIKKVLNLKLVITLENFEVPRLLEGGACERTTLILV